MDGGQRTAPTTHRAYSLQCRFTNRCQKLLRPDLWLVTFKQLQRKRSGADQTKSYLRLILNTTMMLRGQSQLGVAQRGQRQQLAVGQQQRPAIRLPGAAQPRSVLNAALPSDIEQQVGPCVWQDNVASIF